MKRLSILFIFSLCAVAPVTGQSMADSLFIGTWLAYDVVDECELNGRRVSRCDLGAAGYQVRTYDFMARVDIFSITFSVSNDSTNRFLFKVDYNNSEYTDVVLEGVYTVEISQSDSVGVVSRK